MVNQGVVPALMKLLRRTEARQQYAGSALMHIAYSTRTDGTKLKAGSGLLNPLTRMLNGSDSQKTSARQLIAQLARHEDSNRVRITSKEIIPLVIKLLVGSDAPNAFAALAHGKIMWANKANATKAAKCGAVYPLIVLLAGDNLQRAYGACALTELMRASAPIQVEVAEKGATPLFIPLLSGTDYQKDYALIALDRLVYTSAAEVESQGAIVPLVRLLSGTDEQMRLAVFIIAILGRIPAHQSVVMSSCAIVRLQGLLAGTAKRRSMQRVLSSGLASQSDLKNHQAGWVKCLRSYTL